MEVQSKQASPDPLGGDGRIMSLPLHAPAPTPAVDQALRCSNLHYCIERGYVADVQRILGTAAGALAVNSPLEEGETLLHVAADAGSEAIVSALLGAGATVDVQEGVIGRTPLHYALAQGHWAVAGLLLNAGADPALMDKEGLDAAGVAAADSSGSLPVSLSQRLHSQ